LRKRAALPPAPSKETAVGKDAAFDAVRKKVILSLHNLEGSLRVNGPGSVAKKRLGGER